MILMKTFNYKFPVALSALVVLCASNVLSAQSEDFSDDDFYNEPIVSDPGVYDPLEFLNRYTFEFNDFVYLNLLQPVVDSYHAVTPDPIEEGANNFFNNLKYPVRLAGNLLQGRVKGAWVETGRFAINSTLGLGGIMTPADSINGFEPIKPEDIGQAMGAWGIGEGPYLVLPLLGPSNMRDLGGLIADRSVNPLKEPFSLIDDWDWEWRLALSGSELLTSSPGILARYKRLKGSAIDPYSSLKNGFTQYRRGAVED
jgi:phospholipid-binding lipoprotein MlaA